MKPYEFWNCTYKEAYIYAEARKQKEIADYKKEIILFDSFGNKIIGAICSRHPKNKNLITDIFKDLFEEELQPSEKPQSIEEQIRNLRSRK